MASSRPFKLMLFLAIGLAGWATLLWYETGDPPPTWMPRAALVALLAALVLGLIGQETRPRLMLRFLAALFTLLGLLALAADLSLAQAQSGNGGAMTLLDHLRTLAPSLVVQMEAWVERMLGPWAWDPVLTAILGLPAYLLFFLLALAAGIAGRPRHNVRIFVN